MGCQTTSSGVIFKITKVKRFRNFFYFQLIRSIEESLSKYCFIEFTKENNIILILQWCCQKEGTGRTFPLFETPNNLKIEQPILHPEFRFSIRFKIFLNLSKYSNKFSKFL